MVTYLKIFEKHALDKPKFAFKLYSNIVVPNWVDFDWLSSPKRGVVEANLRLSKKVSVIWASSPSWSSFWNESNNILFMAVVSLK